MTDVTLYGECGDCGRSLCLELPATTGTIHTAEQWAKCGKCGHINIVRKGTDMA